MESVTAGDVIGLVFIFTGLVVSIIGVAQAIKSKFYSLGGMLLCIIAVPIVCIGTLITQLL